MAGDQIRVGGEKFPATSKLPFSNDPPPPSFPVTDKTALRQGQLLFLKDNSRWAIVEVKKLSQGDIFIHHPGRSEAWDKSVTRSELRIATPE